MSDKTTRRVVLSAFLILLFASITAGMAFAGGAKEGGQLTSVTFWSPAFAIQEVTPQFIKEWEGTAKTVMPKIAIDSYYGPGKYEDTRPAVLAQGKDGKPDVIEGLLEDLAVYARAGMLEPLDSYFNAWSEKGQFVASTLAPLTIDGKLYGIPYNVNARALVYRKDILQKYNIAVPTTWTDYINAGRTITKMSNKEIYGLGATTKADGPLTAQEFISWYFQVSQKKSPFSMAGGKVKLDATVAQFEKVLTFYDDMFSGAIPAASPELRGGDWDTLNPAYVQGKYAMTPLGPWVWARRTEGDVAKQIIESNTAVGPLPIAEGGILATYLEVKPVMMNVHSKHKKEAWDVITYVTSRDVMANWMSSVGGIPSRSDSFALDAFQKAPIGAWLKGFAGQLPNSVGLGPFNWAPFNSATTRALNAVVYGQKSPHEAAQELYDTLADLVNKGNI